ncbi:MAG: transcriptional regulator [Myxococcales bacterium 68-20]|nr:helix-turn-helix transcriptional regulator [Myxococcales bacterium]OJY17282.1 MAG: transcriptional regulator [Myxococcales bacterium 68-20]
MCRSVGGVLALLGDKWTILIMRMLSTRGQRFSELRRGIGGISQKMLTSTLRALERDGYLSRKLTPTSPPRTDYALTAMGREVLKPINALAVWALENREAVESSRRRYDRRARTARGESVHTPAR